MDSHLPVRNASVWPMVLAVHTSAKARGTPKTAPAAHARMLAGNMTTTATTYSTCPGPNKTKLGSAAEHTC